MRLRNDANRYGMVAVVLHWTVALLILTLFGLGLWMTGLGYYDPWYQKGPALHKGLGVTLFALVVLRLVWRAANRRPEPLSDHAAWERRLAPAVHGLLYLLLFAVMLAGYLISTADGRPVEVFGLFAVPATLSGLEHQEDIAGEVHFALAVTLVTLAGLHAAAALKHHFLDRDRTLLRMLGR
ncbi:MAG TPA: cytochrome b [Gammaproteobacteria bacterium]|nr:cytochrome b [Gammaproteobacteria bacterium]